MAAVRDPEHDPEHFQLQALWDPAQPAISTSEVAIANDLLAGLSPQEVVKYLACSPLSGFAFVTEQERRPYGESYKLHIALPGSVAASVSVCFHHHPSKVSVVWSPAGDRLLVTSSSRVQLVTSASVMLHDLGGCCAARFSTCGRHVAVAHQACSQA